MKKSYILILLCALFACNNASKTNTSSVDSTSVDSTGVRNDTTNIDSSLITLNKEILNSFKNKDYSSIAKYIHPKLGLRFSPYATVSLNNDVLIQANEFTKVIKDKNKFFWGNYDGTGDPIDLNAEDYFARFVYDADFVNAEKTSFNKSVAQGNSINNIDSVYPNGEYIENYFSGFKKEYGGMDWRALRLVFKKEGDQYYLIAIIHDEWTV